MENKNYIPSRTSPKGGRSAGGVACTQEWTAKCKELHHEYFPEPNNELETE